MALVTPLVLVAACGGSNTRDLKVDGPVVPWIATQPAELAERTPASVPCQAADLAATGQVEFTSNGKGGGIAVIALRRINEINHSGTSGSQYWTIFAPAMASNPTMITQKYQ